MTDGVNESTAVAIGCIIGSTILIIFGMFLCYCHSSRNIREQYTQTQSRKYTSIPTQIDMDADAQMSTSTIKQRSDHYQIIATDVDDTDMEDCKHEEEIATDNNSHILHVYEGDGDNNNNELTQDSDSDATTQQTQSTESVHTATNRSLDLYRHEMELKDAKKLFETQESEYPLVKQWLNATHELNEFDKYSYFNLLIMSELTEYEVIQMVNEETLIDIGIEDSIHRKDIVAAILTVNNGENDSYTDSEEYEEELQDMEGTNDSSDFCEDDEQIEEEELLSRLFPTNACGKQYDHTIEFDDTHKLNKLDLSRVHLHKISYWTSNNLLIGMQSEWQVYNDEGKVVQSVQSGTNYQCQNCTKSEYNECNLDFYDFFCDPISLNCADYVHSLSMMSSYFGKKLFGGIGGEAISMSIPPGNIVIGFHGGYGECIHNLGVITIPYTCSVGYDLIKLFFNRYQQSLSDQIIECILNFVFCRDDEHHMDEEDEIKITEQRMMDAKTLSSDSVMNQAKIDAQVWCFCVCCFYNFVFEQLSAYKDIKKGIV